MLTVREIEQALEVGHEVRGIELKGPGSRTDAHLFARVTRAALSLGNLRDGGHIVIGIDDTRQSEMLPGLDDAALKSWLAFDEVSRKLATYADPPLRLDVRALTLSNGVIVAVMQVFEFSDIPHLCSKGYPDVLRKGALYVRPRILPETSEIASSVEMREILDLATEKALRAYISIADRAGLSLSGTRGQAAEFSERQYEEQRDRAWQE